MVGAAFITSAFGIHPGWVDTERGRDECCPYHLKGKRSHASRCRTLWSIPSHHWSTTCRRSVRYSLHHARADIGKADLLLSTCTTLSVGRRRRATIVYSCSHQRCA